MKLLHFHDYNEINETKSKCEDKQNHLQRKLLEFWIKFSVFIEWVNFSFLKRQQNKMYL